VVEIHASPGWPILHGIILNTRPRQSAQKYARIWSNEGSPLLVHTVRQSRMLAGYLGERVRSPLVVDFAMRYGAPSIGGALERLKAAGCDRILVLPLYPQYAASTTALVRRGRSFIRSTRNVPEIRMVRHFHDHPAYIAALTAQVREHWTANGRPDKLLVSFHGLPRFFAYPRRSVSLRMPEDRSPARGSPATCPERLGTHLSVALWARRMATTLYASHAPGARA